jgi:nitroreductase
LDSKQVMDLILTRRSVRKYSDRPVEDELVDQILEAGRWAPSGLNNQPWRFVVVREPGLKSRIAGFTNYSKIIEAAPVVIPVFIHKPSMYSEVKDYQSMGACLENMLLMAHGLGLGAVWLGEILKNADGVRETMDISEDFDLMAVVALGWPHSGKEKGSRKSMDELILKRHDA